MDLKLFTDTYIGSVMKLVSRYDRLETKRIQQLLETGNHYQLNQMLRDDMPSLINAKMLLSAYPGCYVCFDPNCTSDHK